METNYLVWALHNLTAETHKFICIDNEWDNIDWLDYPKEKRPDKEDVFKEIERIKNEVIPYNEYRRNRALSYPPIGDQLDDLFHAGFFSPDMAAKIAAVKDSFPKPTEEV